MSRIVRGNSEAVRRMQPARVRDKEGNLFTPKSFHSLVAEGAISEQELENQKESSKREGFREAEAKLLGTYQAAVQHLEHIVDELSQFRRELFREGESEIFSLISAICRKVISTELSIKPELIQNMLGKALMVLEREKKVVLQFHPQDLEWIRKARPDYLEKVKGLEEIAFEVDSHLEPGHIIAKTRRVELDLSSSAIVNQVLEQLKVSRSEVKETNHEGDTIS